MAALGETRNPAATAYLSQIRRPRSSWDEESGLQACYGKSPGNGAFSMPAIRRRLVRLAPRRADCGLRGTARRGRPASPHGLCRLRAAPRRKSTTRFAEDWREAAGARRRDVLVPVDALQALDALERLTARGWPATARVRHVGSPHYLVRKDAMEPRTCRVGSVPR